MHHLVVYSHTDSRIKKRFEILTNRLEKNGGELTTTHDWLSVLGYAAVEKHDALWVDWSVVGKFYNDLHRKISRLDPHLPMIVFADKTALNGQMCLRNNLLFSVLPLDNLESELGEILERLRIYGELLSEIPESLQQHIRPNGFGTFVGNSPLMLNIYKQIAKVAPTDFTTMITGSSGSGKELVAKAIHELSPRKDHPFISLNCAAIPENLLESELFGYEKGAFTSANQSKPGKFELAHQGTIFLDEIGDMPTNLQAKLLRVLEDHTVERLGGTTVKKVDIRLLAATNQDLTALIKENKFRSDLHYRLNVIPVQLPPLKHKPNDIVLLTLHILGNLYRKSGREAHSISWDLIKALQSMPISGNVRELENILTRILFQASGSDLSGDTLKAVSHWDSVSGDDKPHWEESIQFNEEINPLWKVEKLAIAHALSKLKGNITQVASQLEISRTALYRKIKKYQLGDKDGGNNE